MDGDQLKVRVRVGSEAEVAQELNAIKGVCDVRYQDPFHLIRANPGHELQGAIIAAVGAKLCAARHVLQRERHDATALASRAPYSADVTPTAGTRRVDKARWIIAGIERV